MYDISQTLLSLMHLHSSGTLGWFDGPLGQTRLGIVLDDTTLQLYEKSRYGYEPLMESECLEDWILNQKTDSYLFVEKRTGIYLQF